jgi:hypothetical protein
MNFEDAIRSHVEWKHTLHMAIVQQTKLDAATIARDDCCALGKWLHGDAKSKYGDLVSFKECLGAHANFHREAGRVAQIINGRRFAAAEVALSSGRYSSASERTVTAIVRLKGESAGMLTVMMA